MSTKKRTIVYVCPINHQGSSIFIRGTLAQNYDPTSHPDLNLTTTGYVPANIEINAGDLTRDTLGNPVEFKGYTAFPNNTAHAFYKQWIGYTVPVKNEIYTNHN